MKRKEDMFEESSLEEEPLETNEETEKTYWTIPKIILLIALLSVFISSAMILALDTFTEYRDRNPWTLELDGVAVQPGVTKAEKLVEAGYVLPNAEEEWNQTIPAKSSVTAKIQKANQTDSCISVALINESDQKKCLKDCEVWAVDFIERDREKSGMQSVSFQGQPVEQLNLKALRKQYGEPAKNEEALLNGKAMCTYQWLSGQNGLEISTYEDGGFISFQSWHVVRASFGGVKAAEGTK